MEEVKEGEGTVGVAVGAVVEGWVGVGLGVLTVQVLKVG